MCRGGQEEDVAKGWQAHPFEDTSVNASWTRTIGSETPWETEPILLSGLPMEPTCKELFFKTDCWHNFHLGLAKHFLGSSFVCAVERLDSIQGGSIDSKLEFVTQDFLRFCKENKVNPYMKEISRETLTFPASTACPCGRWSKGAVATQLMQYLEHFCDSFVVDKTEDELMLRVVLCLMWNSIWFVNVCFILCSFCCVVCCFVSYLSCCRNVLCFNCLFHTLGQISQSYEPCDDLHVRQWLLASPGWSSSAFQIADGFLAGILCMFKAVIWRRATQIRSSAKVAFPASCCPSFEAWGITGPLGNKPIGRIQSGPRGLYREAL